MWHCKTVLFICEMICSYAIMCLKTDWSRQLDTGVLTPTHNSKPWCSTEPSYKKVFFLSSLLICCCLDGKQVACSTDLKCTVHSVAICLFHICRDFCNFILAEKLNVPFMDCWINIELSLAVCRTAGTYKISKCRVKTQTQLTVQKNNVHFIFKDYLSHLSPVSVLKKPQNSD